MKGRFTPCSESSPDPEGRKFRARRPTGFTGSNPTVEVPFIHERSPIENEPIHRRHNVYKYPEKSPDEEPSEVTAAKGDKEETSPGSNPFLA
ncbi:hypothetical protein TTRE_0000283001 [Trichuris trichiura]|uniref:Uncharacterized protein n=1 Tax=Trichuris trichiura TaxID=36087 RepID=A0A077Z7A9_TRITR|nr:hypothetical protein TTRE_0000283001 [Trichuris trichiura]